MSHTQRLHSHRTYPVTYSEITLTAYVSCHILRDYTHSVRVLSHTQRVHSQRAYPIKYSENTLTAYVQHPPVLPDAVADEVVLRAASDEASVVGGGRCERDRAARDVSLTHLLRKERKNTRPKKGRCHMRRGT